jgi:hypothetical protein
VVKVLHHAGMAKYPGSRWVFVAGYGRFWVLRCRTEGAEGAEKNEEEKGGKSRKRRDVVWHRHTENTEYRTPVLLILVIGAPHNHYHPLLSFLPGCSPGSP